MNRTRKFDWDEAARLRAQGLSYAKIGTALGVSKTAVAVALNPDARIKARTATSEWQRNGRCRTCGGPASRNRSTGQSLCRSCSARAMARVRDGEAYCPTCDSWKPLAAFSPAPSRPGRGVHKECRVCDTARRRAWRAAHRDHENAYQRERRRREREAAA